MFNPNPYQKMKFISITVALLFFCMACPAESDTLIYYFQSNQYEVNTKKLYELITVNKNEKSLLKLEVEEIRIIAYSDCVGDSHYNQLLSEKRANNTALALKKLLNRQVQIKAMGLGQLECETNVAYADAAKRRVEIMYVAKENEFSDATFDPTTIASLQVGDKIVLKGLNFIGGRHQPTPEGELVLRKLLKLLKDSLSLEIEIQGHICCHLRAEGDGPDLDNHGEPKLSLNRAKHVYDFLIKNGIEASRLSYKGYGGSRPLRQPEITEQDRIANRRVEIMIRK